MLPKRTLAALLVASLSAGCAVGPDYVSPLSPCLDSSRISPSKTKHSQKQPLIWPNGGPALATHS